MSNTAFRDLVGKYDMPIWRKFLSNIVKALGLNKLVNKIEGYTSVKLINEISDIIEDRNSNPDINRLGDGIFYMEDSDPELNKLSKDSKRKWSQCNSSGYQGWCLSILFRSCQRNVSNSICYCYE